jgi:hypothetical protein
MTNAAGPFVTIKPGGPLHGVVTIGVAPDTAEHPLIVDATWKPPDSDPRSLSQPVDEHRRAKARSPVGRPARCGTRTNILRS